MHWMPLILLANEHPHNWSLIHMLGVDTSESCCLSNEQLFAKKWQACTLRSFVATGNEEYSAWFPDRLIRLIETRENTNIIANWTLNWITQQYTHSYRPHNDVRTYVCLSFMACVRACVCASTHIITFNTRYLETEKKYKRSRNLL